MNEAVTNSLRLRRYPLLPSQEFCCCPVPRRSSWGAGGCGWPSWPSRGCGCQLPSCVAAKGFWSHGTWRTVSAESRRASGTGGPAVRSSSYTDALTQTAPRGPDSPRLTGLDTCGRNDNTEPRLLGCYVSAKASDLLSGRISYK